MIKCEHYDVAIIGGGTAGVVAAIAAARNGANTVLVESAPFVGGEMTSIIPYDGCKSVQGKWVLGGIGRELFERCREYDGYIGDIFDWRMMWAICLDPEVMKLVIVQELARSNVKVLLNTFATDVVIRGKCIEGINVVGKGGKQLIRANVVIDCTGDADIATFAGVPYELGDNHGGFQPVTLMYRMSNVNANRYLEYVRDNSSEFLLAAHPSLGKSEAECALELYKRGLPCAAIDGKSKIIQSAIEKGEMEPCTALFVFPTSLKRKEVCINMTRVVNVDANDGAQLGAALPKLVEQTIKGANFLINYVPGFEDSSLCNVGSRIGIRETRRIVGEYVLNQEDVTGAHRFEDVIAQGAHHVDIHVPVEFPHIRIPVKDGQSYDIPFRCLIPLGLDNLLVAGRCISSTREGNSSVRVMAQCMATGEAAGTAAAMCVKQRIDDVRNLEILKLQEKLRLQGAIID